MSDSLWPHGLQHIRLPRPSLFPGVYSDSCPLSEWCYLTISPSATFSFGLQPFPAPVQFSRSVVSDSLRPHELQQARQASLSITSSQSLLKLMSIESVMPPSHLILCRPLLLLHPIPPSIRVFSNESTLHIRWPKYWSFSFSISPSNEHPGLIFRMDQLDLLAVQGTSLRPTQLQLL